MCLFTCHGSALAFVAKIIILIQTSAAQYEDQIMVHSTQVFDTTNHVVTPRTPHRSIMQYAILIYIHIYILYWHKSHLIKMFFRISQKKQKILLLRKKKKRKAVLSQLNVLSVF